MTFGIYTLGCKVNKYESQAIAESFEKKGFERRPFEEVCDVYIINTCHVTAESDRKSANMIRRARRRNKDGVVAVCGCMSQDSKTVISEADIIIGNGDKLSLCDRCIKFFEDKKSVFEKSSLKSFEKMSIESFPDRTRADLKIEDGCDNFCAYCIIPYVRGRIRSKNIEDAVSEAKKLCENGFSEIVLTGIHITSYGKDKDFELCDLLDELNKVEGLKRIRLGSLEPGYINEIRAERMKKIKSLCPHFHISLQSGSETVLNRMKRRYTPDDYYNEIEIIRKYFPTAQITTDIIVGFPGETEEEFNETLGFAEKCRFSKIHIFRYSARKGTVAAEMDNQISPQVKAQRAAGLAEKAEEIRMSELSKYINKTVNVLFEQRGKDGFYIGYTDNYLLVAVYDNKTVSGERNVRITKIENDRLLGEVIYTN